MRVSCHRGSENRAFLPEVSLKSRVLHATNCRAAYGQEQCLSAVRVLVFSL